VNRNRIKAIARSDLSHQMHLIILSVAVVASTPPAPFRSSARVLSVHPEMQWKNFAKGQPLGLTITACFILLA